eukprot:TRINITY_DN6665_c0_g2_i1.p1 TRINITY_DN6665_c0_g2~~TRINITY_DN6665_c0_g2_i1.p1  ORF type:complete len:202 (-),score=25.39 TRINITY_DN6665_c0_g2_i1:32-637(-)
MSGSARHVFFKSADLVGYLCQFVEIRDAVALTRVSKIFKSYSARWEMISDFEPIKNIRTPDDNNYQPYYEFKVMSPLALIELWISWRDQGWGNRKGLIQIRLLRGSECLHEALPFPIADHSLRNDHAIYDRSDDIVREAKPGDTIDIQIYVGGGGGHALTITSFKALIDGKITHHAQLTKPTADHRITYCFYDHGTYYLDS